MILIKQIAFYGILTISCLLTGCKPKPVAIMTYTIPKAWSTTPQVSESPASIQSIVTAQAEWTAPSSWTAQPLSPIYKAHWKTHSIHSLTADVTITAFPNTVGSLASNINRWRAQIDMNSLSDSEALQLAEHQKIGGVSGFYVELMTDIPGSSSSVIATCMHANNSWFFKLSGPSEVVAQELSTFKIFLETVQFP